MIELFFNPDIVIEAEDPQVETLRIPPTEPLFPVLTGTGDNDFWGYGPKVSLKTDLKVHNDNQLYAYVWFRAVEEGGDKTRAEGRFVIPVVDNIGEKRILKFKEKGGKLLESQTVRILLTSAPSCINFGTP